MGSKIPQGNYLAGKLLLAMPSMGDDRFDHAVIFICAHDENGAMGLIINKPIVSDGNKSSFLKTINFIKHNYSSIQKEMMKNILPTKKNFQKEMSDILTEDKNKIS